LQQAIQRILERYRVQDLLTVEWAAETTTVTRSQGRGRPGAGRKTATETQVRYVIRKAQRNQAAITAHCHRLGWRVQATNARLAQLSLAQAIVRYRGGWVLERDFRLVKDLPLGLSPLFVWKDDQIKGLTRLLTIALRLLTLIESQVRQGLQQEGKRLAGLYRGQARRETDRPTGQRIQQAFARAQITLTRIAHATPTAWHLTPRCSRAFVASAQYRDPASPPPCAHAVSEISRRPCAMASPLRTASPVHSPNVCAAACR
jgi:transposase